MLVPLLTLRLLNAVFAVPEMVAFPAPEKVTVLVLAENVPLLVQLPFIVRLLLPVMTSDPLMVKSLQVAGLPMITTEPAGMITWSSLPGIAPFSQVDSVCHGPDRKSVV